MGARDASRGQISQGLEAVMQAGLAPRSRETASWAPLRCEVGRIGHGHLAEKSGFCHGTDRSWPPLPGSSHPEGTGGVGPRQEPDFVTRVGLALSLSSELCLQCCQGALHLLPTWPWVLRGAMDPRGEWRGTRAPGWGSGYPHGALPISAGLPATWSQRSGLAEGRRRGGGAAGCRGGREGLGAAFAYVCGRGGSLGQG